MTQSWVNTPVQHIEDAICTSTTFINSIPAGVDPHDRVDWFANEAALGGTLARPFVILSVRPQFMRDGIGSSWKHRARGEVHALFSKDAMHKDNMKLSVQEFCAWYGDIVSHVANVTGCDGLFVTEIKQEDDPIRTLADQRTADAFYDFWNVGIIFTYGI